MKYNTLTVCNSLLKNIEFRYYFHSTRNVQCYKLMRTNLLITSFKYLRKGEETR